MDSGMVRAIAFNCHQLQPRAQECSDKMKEAIAGQSDYWVDLGGDEFRQHCMDWIGKMNKFKEAVAKIETGMLNYANQLQVEEAKAEAARKEAEKQAAERAAAASKMTGKTK